MQSSPAHLSFFGRLKLAISTFSRVLGDAAFAGRLQSLDGLAATSAAPTVVQPNPAAKPVEISQDEMHASGLALLGIFQREGRLVDFLQEDLAAFSDAEIGAAARVMHTGSRKVLAQYLKLEPVLKENDGDAVTVKAGFDAQRIRLTGNISGQPPFRGTLKHHGWIATEVNLPAVAKSLDPRVIAPAEVEL